MCCMLGPSWTHCLQHKPCSLGSYPLQVKCKVGGELQLQCLLLCVQQLQHTSSSALSWRAGGVGRVGTTTHCFCVSASTPTVAITCPPPHLSCCCQTPPVNTRDMVSEFEQVSMAMSEPDANLDALTNKMTRLQVRPKATALRHTHTGCEVDGTDAARLTNRC